MVLGNWYLSLLVSLQRSGLIEKKVVRQRERKLFCWNFCLRIIQNVSWMIGIRAFHLGCRNNVINLEN